MFRLFYPIILLFIAQAALAQQPVLQWVKSFTTEHYMGTLSNGRTIGVDGNGNVYTAGILTNTIDMDPGTGTYPLTAAGRFTKSIYISKLDAAGNFVWAQQIPTYTEFAEIELKIDKAGNIYLAADLREEIDIDSGPGVQMMKPTGFKDAFVMKLDKDGMCVWARQFGGPGDTGPESHAIDIDKDGNVIICGYFNNTVDFDPGPAAYNLTSSAHQQAYIAKLNNNGDFIWAKQFGNSPIVYSGSKVVDVKCDAQGNIYTAGSFAGACDFDPGPGVYSLSASGRQDGFISKLTANGDFVWAKQLKNTTGNFFDFLQPRTIELDRQNNILSTGYFAGTVDFDPGTTVKAIASNGSDDCYVIKLANNGDLLWVKTIGGTDTDGGNDLVVDNGNNVYVAGSFGPQVDFDPGPGDSTITTPGYGASAIFKLDSRGNFVYAAAFPGNGYTLFRRMEIDAARNIYVTGYGYGNIDFDPTTSVYNLPPSNNWWPFVLKLSPCPNPTAAVLNIDTCRSVTLNNETFNTSGTYTQTVRNAAGCDSVITIHLAITQITNQQTISICEGEQFYAGGSFQTTAGKYIDTVQTALGCDSVVTTYLNINPKPLPDLGQDKSLCNGTEITVSPGTFVTYLWQDGSTDMSYKINTAGSYWVEVTNNFHCTAADTLVIPSLLPNPSGYLKETDSICINGNLTVSSIFPYQQYQWSTDATDKTIQLRQTGIYWLKVIDANGCSGVDSITIFPKKCQTGFQIPNAFTPNGDGKNDLFRPLLYENVKKYHFSVFNRWGVMVFDTTDPQMPWNGGSQSAGTFTWMCTYQFEEGGEQTQYGTVLLIR